MSMESTDDFGPDWQQLPDWVRTEADAERWLDEQVALALRPPSLEDLLRHVAIYEAGGMRVINAADLG